MTDIGTPGTQSAVQSWALTVAGLTILVDENDEPWPAEQRDRCRPFITQAAGSVICSLRSHAGRPAIDTEPLCRVFGAHSIWAVFLWNSKRVFVNPNCDNREWQRSILWDPVAKQVEVWMSPNPPVHDVFGDLRYPFLAALFAYHEVALPHAAAVVVNEEAWLFVGPSGYGKSTWSQSCRRRGHTVLDEDRIALRTINGQVWAFGTPWHLESRLCSPQGAPVRRIFFLQEAEHDTVRSTSRSQAAIRLLKSFVTPIYDARAMQVLLELADRTTKQAENYLLGYALDSQLLDRILLM